MRPEVESILIVTRSVQVFQPPVPFRVVGVWLDEDGQTVTEDYTFLGFQVCCIERYSGPMRKPGHQSPPDTLDRKSLIEAGYRLDCNYPGEPEYGPLFWGPNLPSGSFDGITTADRYRESADGSAGLVLGPLGKPQEWWQQMIEQEAEVLRIKKAT